MNNLYSFSKIGTVVYPLAVNDIINKSCHMAIKMSIQSHFSHNVVNIIGYKSSNIYTTNLSVGDIIMSNIYMTIIEMNGTLDEYSY